jgi:bifunctional non-homologous end joining protein LigD
MSLATYSKKRNFKQTPEPGAGVTRGKGANTFVIQRHNATRLHYDFRLEVNGVLKSWAIPKGPSLNPTDKRLAVMVEDHPLSYASFKGTIPEGNYGAGIVEIWDRGTYVPEEMEKISDKEIERHINKGMLKFSLKGKKIKGSFALVRIKGSDSKNWLLIKHRDKYATDKEYSSEDVTAQNSPINKALKLKSRKLLVGSAAKKSAVTKTAVSKSPVRKSAGSKTAATKSAAPKSAAPKSAVGKVSSRKSAGKKSVAAKKSSVKSDAKADSSSSNRLKKK